MASVRATLPNTREEVEAWLQNAHNTADSLNISNLENIYAKDAAFRFANGPIVEGFDAIKQQFLPAYGVLASMKHVTRNFDMVENRIWFSVDITYHVKGDPENKAIEIPASAFAVLVTGGEEAGKMSRFEVYLDNQPVMERVGAVLKAANSK